MINYQKVTTKNKKKTIFIECLLDTTEVGDATTNKLFLRKLFSVKKGKYIFLPM